MAGVEGDPTNNSPPGQAPESLALFLLERKSWDSVFVSDVNVCCGNGSVMIITQLRDHPYGLKFLSWAREYGKALGVPAGSGFKDLFAGRPLPGFLLKQFGLPSLSLLCFGFLV